MQDTPSITPSHWFSNQTPRDYPILIMNPNSFEILNIPDRGQGLVARCNIRSGTRILCEQPLFLISGNTTPETMSSTVASILNPLSREEQRKFLELCNNFPGRNALAGIIKTNALPCGPGASTGGIYLNICRINHSCVPNCHSAWNKDIGAETVHAIRDILAGDEITIAYDRGEPFEARQAFLLQSFGFRCRCDLCGSSPDQLEASDQRRRKIQVLDAQIGDADMVMARPVDSLHACHELYKLLVEEHRSEVTASIPRLYFDAFQIAIAHGDQARAMEFAERAYKARVACEGNDNPATKKIKRLMQDPASHLMYGEGSMMWKTDRTSQPSQLDGDLFEKWLWYQID